MMEIIINGLPEGHKIKHINVDIKFDDNGAVTINKKVEPIETPKLADVEPEPEMVEKPKIKQDDREKKEIPQEMTNQEF